MEPRSKDAQAPESAQPVRGVPLTTAALLLLVAAVVGLTGALGVRWLLWRGQPAEASDNHRPAAIPLFQGWPRPELVLVLSGEQHGYLLPCGCSKPQVGGLERRYNFVQQLRKDRGWPVVALDLGDVAQQHGPQQLPNFQGGIKYIYAMKALREIGYAATSIGEYEAALPLDKALDGLLTHDVEQPRVLVCNLKDADNAFPNETAPWLIASPKEKGTDVRIGVVGVVGAVVAEHRIKDPRYSFESVPAALPKALAALQQQKPAPDLNVLLYQGTLDQAEKLARAIPDFRIILCLSDDGEHQYDEPAAQPQVVKHARGETWIIHLGHKGKYVGVVGIFPTGVVTRPFDLRYQLVSLGEEYLTPEDQEADHPILKLMEEYTQELKHDPGTGNYLAKYAALQWSHPMQSAFANAQYVGSAKCQKCHAAAFAVWAGSKHAHAYEELVKAKKPSSRQYDGECVVCHVVGLGYKTGFTSEKDTPHLLNVGCESCHGPASEHVKKPNDAKIRELLNPWKELEAKAGEDAASQTAARNRRHLLRDQACQKCHDQDNDVHWDFDKKWPLVEHH
jgi:hypothetical protein